MSTLDDQERYLIDMLDKANQKHVSFIEEFHNKMACNPVPGPQGMKVYRKAEETEDYFSVPSKKTNGGQRNINLITGNSQHPPVPDAVNVRSN